MQSRPNKTVLRAIFNSFVAAADGIGGNVELKVLHNETPSPDDDFIRPAIGQSLRAFASEAPSMPPGSEVHVELKLLGGPNGERAIVQAMSKKR